MARGRSTTRPGALPLRPPALALPADHERVSVTGKWEPWLAADRPTVELVSRLNAGWRLPAEIGTGPYSNGREQGIRFTRPASERDTGLTVWLSEYRTSDHIVVYTLGGESHLLSWAGLPEAERIYDDKWMLGYDEGERALALVVEQFHAVPLDRFAPPAPVGPRRGSLRDAMRRPRG